MREAMGLARGLELERFRADAGWGIPEPWLLEKPAIVCLFGARVSMQVLGSELIHFLRGGGYFSGPFKGAEEVRVLRHCSGGMLDNTGENVCIP